MNDKNADTTNNETENTNTDTSGESPTEKAKRTRTSPRTKALDEVLVMIDAHVADLKAQDANEDDDAILAEHAGAFTALNDIRGRIVSLSDEGAPKPTYGGRHYISVSEDGTRTHFQANMVPTKRSHGVGSKTNFASVLGPFRTEDGVAHRLAHPETECPIVF